MANPLARVVMNNIAQRSGMVEKRTSYTAKGRTSTDASRSNGSGSVNLDKRESQLLSSLLNNKKGTTMGSSSASYDKSTYGRTTNVSNVAANTMKTLDSLVKKSSSTESASTPRKSSQTTSSCGIDKSRKDLRSLCSLSNISVGKTDLEKEDRDVMKRLDSKKLVDNKIKTDKREEKISYGKQTSGMTTLESLAKEKTKHSHSESGNVDKSSQKYTDTITTGNSYVKSNVINNLEAYIPKVTLESIGKKGSLF